MKNKLPFAIVKITTKYLEINLSKNAQGILLRENCLFYCLLLIVTEY